MKRYILKKETLKKIPSILFIILGFILIFFFYKCPFYSLFNIPCPGCGMTRAYKSLLLLNIQAAFEYHPLFPLPLLAVIYQLFHKKVNIGKKNEGIVLIIILILFLVRWIIILKQF